MKKLSVYSGIVILIFSLVFPGPYFGDVSAENEVNTGDTATVETGNSMTDIEKDETQSELESGTGDIQDNSANIVDDSDNEFLLKNLNDFQPTSISLLGAGNDTNNEDLPDDTDSGNPIDAPDDQDQYFTVTFKPYAGYSYEPDPNKPDPNRPEDKIFSVQSGSTISKPTPDPTNPGIDEAGEFDRTFLGWYKDGELYDFSTPITGDIELYARRENPKYEVYLDYNGGKDGINYTATHYEYNEERGSYLDAILPKREGYNFNGWYWDKEGTIEYDRKPVYSGITLYAGWEPWKDYSNVSYTSCDLKEGIYYKDNVLDYLDHKGNRFQPGTITVSDGKDCITMLDRNLGATMTGGMFSDGNYSKYYYHPDTYGYFYQRGNNYGFSTVNVQPPDYMYSYRSIFLDPSEETSYEEVQFENYGPGNYYNSNIFKLKTDLCNGPLYCFDYGSYWKYSNQYGYNKRGGMVPVVDLSNMRGGGNDSPENERGLYLDNDEDRQGPCPNGYHVPNAGEWKKLYLIWHNYTDKGYSNCDNIYNCYKTIYFSANGLTGFQNDLYLPAPGRLGGNFYAQFPTKIPTNNDDGDIKVRSASWYGVYHSSSPEIGASILGGGSSGKLDPFYEVLGITDIGVGLGLPIRCFKNKQEKFTVTFDYNGLEEAPTTREVSKGGTLSEPSPKPERFGYNFAGWYTDKGCKTKYDFSTKIESDITLYAKREPREDYSGISYTACDTAPGIVHDSNLTVNYTDPNGNNFKAGTITISDGQDCITMLDRNLGATEAGVGTGYSMPKVNGYDMDQWVQYYARYDSGYYGYKFQRGNNYGFKLGLKIYPQSLDTDASTIKFSETPAVYNNYGPTKRYKNDTFRITYNENNMKNEDYWSSNQHYDNLRGGENDSAENGRGLYLDNDKERQGPCPSGYHVPSAGEWNKAIIIWANNHKNDNIHTSTTGYFGPFESHISVGEINKHNTIGKNSRMLFQEDLMLPSEWDIAKYDSRDALHYGNFQSKYYHGSYWTSTPGGRYEGLSNSLLIDVYNAGVYNGASFSNRSYGKNIRCFKNKGEETTTTYTVTFESNGGSPTPSSQTIKERERATKPSQDPTRSGYTFKYRYSTSSSTGYDFNSPVTQNLTLYAGREENSNGGGGGGGGGEGGGTTIPNTYTVYFDSNGGTSVSSKRVQDGDYVSEPPEPTRKGYTFLGRYTRTTGGREITFREKITNDTTYYAQWQENSYTIRYNLNGGNGSISSDTVDYSERVRLPSSPSRNGYTFDGWNTRSNGNGTHYNGGTYVSKLSDRDGDIITLYAQRTDSPNSDNNSNTESSNLSISLYNTKNPTTNEWIGVNIKTDTKYTGKISFGKLQYYSYDVSKWIDVPYSTKAYVYDYDDYIDDGFRLTTNDFGSMIIKNLIKFNKEGNYRIYISDKNGYETSLQLYVKPSENENIITNTGTTDIPQPIKDIQNILDGNDQKNQNNITLDTTDEVYIARSCKEYKIQYNAQLGVFTSPNLNKNEYFVNKEYFKRYIDSKNKWKQGCPTNGPRISTSYIEKSTDTDKYIAPNGKVYFISIQNGLYISKELNSQSQTFGSLSAIKYFIRDRNPLIKM